MKIRLAIMFAAGALALMAGCSVFTQENADRAKAVLSDENVQAKIKDAASAIAEKASEK